MSDNLAEIANDLIRRIIKAGASAADVVAVNGQSVSVEVRNGEVENSEQADGVSLGLRAFVGQSQAIVTANRFKDADLEMLVERAVAMAKIAPQDPYSGLADASELATDLPDLDMADGDLPDTSDLVKTALAVEAAGLAVEGVTKSEGGTASARRNEIFLVTSTGFAGHYVRTGHSFSASMIAGKDTGMERDYDYSSAVHRADLEDVEKIGRSAGERAVRRLNPKKVASQKCPVVFDQRVAASLVGHLSGAVNGSSVARGTSFLKDLMGKKVFADGIAIIDDGRMMRGLASKPFDGEGIATGKRSIIENGILQSWLLDCRSARQLGLKSTGNASRGSNSPPSPSSTNLYLQAGSQSPQELYGDIKNGFYVTELIGMGVNGVTGDYSRGASGFWIENGELAFPVNGVTIAGNLKDMFANLTPASDLQFHGATNAPTCRIEEMTLAGT